MDVSDDISRSMIIQLEWENIDLRSKIKDLQEENKKMKELKIENTKSTTNNKKDMMKDTPMSRTCIKEGNKKKIKKKSESSDSSDSSDSE